MAIDDLESWPLFDPSSKERTVNNSLTLRRNTRLAKRTWNVMSSEALRRLKDLTIAYDLSIAAGHLLFLNNNWYVTHAGLLYIAADNYSPTGTLPGSNEC